MENNMNQTLDQINKLSNIEAVRLANESGWFMEESEFTRNNPDVYAKVAKDFLELIHGQEQAVYILEHNHIDERYVKFYSGKEPFPKGGHGYSQADWKKAWSLAQKIMVVRNVAYRMEGIPDELHKDEIVFHGNPLDYVSQI
jgi:hypothetical protein